MPVRRPHDSCTEICHMNTVAFYDTKPYDREYFERAPEASRLRRQFHEFRLTTETAASVDTSRK